MHNTDRKGKEWRRAVESDLTDLGDDDDLTLLAPFKPHDALGKNDSRAELVFYAGRIDQDLSGPLQLPPDVKTALGVPVHAGPCTYLYGKGSKAHLGHITFTDDQKQTRNALPFSFHA